MKVLLLAGGLGTRLSEETDLKPKPMVEIGGKPILWHIMKTYSRYGFNEFVVLLGYKGYLIKEYFANYFLHQSDVTIDMTNGKMEVLNNSSEPWKITLLDTGAESMTGGRVKRAKDLIGNETFMLTYGDGVSDVDINRLIEFHRKKDVLATLTAVYPPGRFGALEMNDGKVQSFREKPQGDGARINGGFFILSPKVIDYIKDDTTIWEQGPLEQLASDGELAAFEHDGFWQPMDTLNDRKLLERLWQSGQAPWKVW
jgi:glucose-1-phosphate cytidylyltransferase